MQHQFSPRGVCSRHISFSITDGKLHEVCFEGGCNGNLKAIGILTEGMDAAQAAAKLKGNTCGFKGTSCADQLALAIEEALTAEK